MPTELDHCLVTVAKGEARQLATPTIAIEETDMPSLTEGERHQDFVHESGPFPWELGLEGRILPWREGDEACPDAPAADAGLECLSLVDADLEPTEKFPYLIQGR